MSDDEDPFDRLGDDAEREGDPFEHLDPPDGDAAADEDPGRDETPSPAAESNDDPLADRTPGQPPVGESATGPPESSQPDHEATGPGTSAEAGDDEATGDVPGGAADDQPGPAVAGPEVEEDPLGGVRTPEEDPFEGETFQRVGVDAADPDEVWEAVVEGEDEPPEPPAETRYAEVSKHSFCEHCEFFSGPPEVHCTHETAEIVEFLDMETVRLLDCPIVAEREALEQEE